MTVSDKDKVIRERRGPPHTFGYMRRSEFDRPEAKQFAFETPTGSLQFFGRPDPILVRISTGITTSGD